MDYLSICRKVRELSGAQGNGPTSVDEVAGYEVNLVGFVDSAYDDLQNSRRDFKFMRANSLFSTVASQDTYTLLTDDIANFKTMRVQAGTKWTYLEEVDYDTIEHAYINIDTEKIPKYFAKVPGTENDIKLYPTPDTIYNLYYDYYRKPEELTLNEDVPMLPSQWHYLIIYDALERFAGFLASANMDEKYIKAASKLRQRFYAEEVPGKAIRYGRSFAI